MIQILVVDDNDQVRATVRRFLEGRAGWTVCGEAANGEDAVRLAAALQPDVVLLDIQMPVMNGFDAARRILHSSPDVPILIVSFYDDRSCVQEARNCGAKGFVTKNQLGDKLISAISTLLRGDSHFPTLQPS